MSRSALKLVFSALTAAVYAAVTMLLAPVSYGALQLRLSEVLCILPFFVPCSAWGLFIGCAVSNILSAGGILDVIFGSAATLLASLCTSAAGRGFRIGGGLTWRSSLMACAWPVIFNAPIIGAVLSASLTPGAAFWKGFFLFGAQVGAGEAIVMFAAGLPVLRHLSHSESFSEVFRKLS